ncbi:related to transcription activator protein acu-15 [Phialocephala subalpina]|uniref:Related to transcription activator protein acu-15 n=1 Tax=Phialocephala subalpina TaxID=576137 RepID=A0A1L7XJ97_9HELO|nr:related to transcription activator protein acu-15 [Phialocephala subalpina]
MERLPSTDVKADKNAEQSTAHSSTNERRNRKRRLHLSCGECRKKKVPPTLPAAGVRAISGRPDECSFETTTGHPPVSSYQSAQQAQRNSEDVRDLRAEVAELRELLSKGPLQYESNCIEEHLLATNNVELSQAATTKKNIEKDLSLANAPKTELLDPRERSPRVYYSQHTLLQFFGEIPQLFPFIKETVDEWLKPLGVTLKKNKSPKNDRKARSPSQHDIPLDVLLPEKDDIDILVSFYLQHFEQLHRIVHIPTFKREYANFWIPGRTRYPAMTALILSMISISCASASLGAGASIASRYQAMPVQWVSACEEWLGDQSSKHRKLVHYQISCLVYLAKRINIIRKKRWWKDTGSLVQDALSDGIHRESHVDTPYMREMERRIWAVIQELDLQNSFEYGLPSFLYSIDSDVGAPANLNDEDFDEGSKALPTSRPPSQYTYTSYQSHSSRSWKLRIEISRQLFSTGVSRVLRYEDVLKYTHELTQAMDSLSRWDIDDAKSEGGAKRPALAYAYLHFQLKECILAIHRPYLQRDSGKFWLSENVCYQMSRDILLLNTKLAGLGVQSLTLLREDLLLASLSLCRITFLQPRGSASIIMANSLSTVELLEQCLPLMEERYLRCFYGEPWCFLTICATTMLLKVHLGEESWATGKSSCAKRFLELHYKHIGRHQASPPSQHYSMSEGSAGQFNTLAASQQLPTASATVFQASEWLDGNYSDIATDPFDLDMDVYGICDTWGSMWPTLSSQPMNE